MATIKKLDFADVRDDFKNFLSNQDEFTDYDLTQSGFDQLINIMAYGIHTSGIQANFSNNEMHLKSAQLRKNVTGRAKHMMYTPKSATAARAIVDITVTDTDSNILPNTIFIPKGSKFVTKDSLTETVSFVTTSAYIANKTGDRFIFTNIPIYQGVYANTTARYNGTSVQIDNELVDTSTVEVYVQEDAGSVTYTKYDRMTNLFKAKGDSRVFYLEENFNDRYEIYFGDGVLGKKVESGRNVLVTYVVTTGNAANGISEFGFAKSPDQSDAINLGKVTIITKERASGGSMKEDIDSIKFNAPKFFTSNQIILNDEDATNIIPHSYPDIKSVNVWSGKGSGVFGKTYVSFNPYIDNLEQSRIDEIIADIESSRTVILTQIEHISPVYIDLNVIIRVYFDGVTSIDSIKSNLYETILNYSENHIEDFKKKFISSRFIKTIDANDLQYDFSLNIISRVPVFVNALENYSFDFKNPISSVKTNEFIYQGSSALIRNDGSKLVLVYAATDSLIKEIGTVDLKSGKGAINTINIQSITGNTLVVKAVPVRESIFSSDNNILRILEKDIDISFEEVKNENRS